MRAKLYAVLVFISHLFAGKQEESGKAKALRFCFYLLLVIIANILLSNTIPSRDYPWSSQLISLLILNINILLILALIIVLFRNLTKLLSDRKERVFGARLQTRLVIFAVLLVVVPVSLTYYISTRMVRTSINRWFDDNVQDAVNTAVELAADYKEEALNSIATKTEYLAQIIAPYSIGRARYIIKEYIDRRLFDGAAIYSANALSYVYQNPKFPSPLFAFADDSLLSRVRAGGEEAGLYTDEESGMSFFWSAYPLKNNGRINGALITLKETSSKNVKNSAVIRGVASQIDELRFFSYPLIKAFDAYNVLVACFVVFACVWLAMTFMRSITGPLKALSDASLKIADGRFDISLDTEGSDEIASLSKTFSDMATALKERTSELARKNRDLLDAMNQIQRDKRNTDIIYRNVEQGLVLYDSRGGVLKANDTAKAVISAQDAGLVPADFLEANEIERTIRFELTTDGARKVWSARISKIFDTSGKLENILLVADDITDLLNLQRITLWREVAARIAHEIKNPLTPIKLTAERVKKRSKEIASDSARELVEASMRTIVEEVSGLMALLEEFNQYAKPPSLTRAEVNIKALAESVAELLGADKKAHIEVAAEEGLTLLCDSAQIRRVLINLIQNSKQAGAAEIAINARAGERKVVIEVSDNGEGIKEDDLGRVFLPYFSQKPEGTGLGLAIVKKIVEEHGGTISAESVPNSRTCFRIVI